MTVAAFNELCVKAGMIRPAQSVVSQKIRSVFTSHCNLVSWILFAFSNFTHLAMLTISSIHYYMNAVFMMLILWPYSAPLF